MKCSECLNVFDEPNFVDRELTTCQKCADKVVATQPSGPNEPQGRALKCLKRTEWAGKS
ncbi:hypothetical protein AAVH_28236, partial [Aphelenchoides avenae]